ncbi:hypothetical protein LX13_000821 [Williamsia maris]|uniref:Uncharacterized protein n=1 Tax=Williamsia maris TaxID=72806 RepID=A0ABT1HA08_9NOCA|nr:hypothetical protein [Williamsia maris]
MIDCPVHHEDHEAVRTAIARSMNVAAVYAVGNGSLSHTTFIWPQRLLSILSPH